MLQETENMGLPSTLAKPAPTMENTPLPPKPAPKPKPTMENTPLPKRPAPRTKTGREKLIGVDHNQVGYWGGLRDALDDLVKEGHPELSWKNVIGDREWNGNDEEDYWNYCIGRIQGDDSLRTQYDRILHDEYGQPYKDLSPMTPDEQRSFMRTGLIPDSYTNSLIPDDMAQRMQPGGLPMPDASAPAIAPNIPQYATPSIR